MSIHDSPVATMADEMNPPDNDQATDARPWKPRGWPAWCGGALIGAVVTLIAVAAVGKAIETPAPPTPTTPLYIVRNETIERSHSFVAQAEWPPAQTLRASGSGKITSVADLTKPLQAGDVLMTVNLRPVVLAVGSVPSFRSLTLDAKGQDVVQLSRLMRSIGIRKSRETSTFDAGLANDVKRWQKKLGLTPTGVVEAGDIVYVESLPAYMRLDEAAITGTEIASGAALANTLASAPAFRITLDPNQGNLTRIDSTVTIDSQQGTWKAKVSKASETDGKLILELQGPEGAAVCGDSCESVPRSGVTDYPSRIEIVSPTSGPTVPLSAIATDPGGSKFVISSSGKRIPVKVVAATNGLAVVEGLAIGDKIRVFAEPRP